MSSQIRRALPGILLVISMLTGMKLPLTGQSMLTIGNGTSASFHAPVYISWVGSSYRYSNHISLIGKSEINFSGIIESIGWHKSNNPGYSAGNASLSIYLKHTNDSVVPTSSGTFTSQVAGAQQVYASTTQNINTFPGWQTFPLDTPFHYNGTDNLMVLVSWYRPSDQTADNPSWYYTLSPGKAASWAFNTNPPTALYGAGSRPNIQLEFTSTVSNDASVVGILSPQSPVPLGSSPVSVAIRNLGNDTLNSLQINWRIDSLPQPPCTWSGSLPYLMTADSIVIGSYAFGHGPHDITAWSSLPNNATDTVNHNDTASLAIYACNTMSGIYTIGSANADFPTIHSAVSELTRCGVSDPVTFHILPGTYLEQIELKEYTGASDSTLVTFTSSTGDPADVVIRYGQMTALKPYTIWLNGTGYLKISNLTIEVDDGQNIFGEAIRIGNGVNKLYLDSNIIRTRPFAASGIYPVHFMQSRADSVRIKGNRISGGHTGIFWEGAGIQDLSSGNIIEENQVLDWSNKGMDLNDQNAIVVRKNLVSSSSSSYLYGLLLTACENGFLVEGNRIEALNTGRLLKVMQCAGSPGNRCLIANNLMVQKGSACCSYGLIITQSQWIRVAHNTISMKSAPAVFYAAISIISSYQVASEHLDFLNNIVDAGPGGLFDVLTQGVAPFDSIDYNDYHSTTGLGYWDNSWISGLQSLQNLTGQDVHSISVDPLLNPLFSYCPFNWSIDDLGTPLQDVTTDIHGQPRDTLTPDLGCTEFSMPITDAGLLGFLTPDSVTLPGIQPIIVTLKNFGQDVLDSVWIGLKLNGDTMGFTQWTGTLAPDSLADSVYLGSHKLGLGQNSLEAWTFLPNGAPDSTGANDAAAMTTLGCQQRTSYTIGDSMADYPSIHAAIQNLIHCGYGGGITYNILPGTYDEQLTLPAMQGLDSNLRITFQSANSNPGDVIITNHSAGSGDNYTVKFDGAGFYSLKYLTIRATNPAFGHAVVLTGGASYNEVAHCVIQSPAGSSVNTVPIFSSSSIDHHNAIVDNVIDGGSTGILFDGGGPANDEEGNTVSGNDIRGWFMNGIVFDDQKDGFILNNTIRSYEDSPGLGMDGIQSQFMEGGVISGNIVIVSALTSGQGITLSWANTSGDSTLVSNNMVSITSASGGQTIGLYTVNSRNLHFYYNSIHVISGFSSSSRSLYSTGTTTGGNKLVNNILVNRTGGLGAYISAPLNFSLLDHNAYYLPNSSSFGFFGAAVPDLAAWRIITNQEGNSLVGDPGFQSDSILIPSSVGVNNHGMPLSSVPYDIFGTARDTSFPDIGAIEYDPASFDMHMLAWDAPTGGNCYYSGNENVVAAVINNSFIPHTGFVLSYSTDGGISFISDTITHVVGPGDTLIHVFSATADVSIPGTYSCIVAVSMAGDIFPSNDTAWYTLVVIAPDTMPYAETFETFIPGNPGIFKNGWIAEPSSTGTFRFRVNQGPTNTAYSGPLGDHTTGTGVYVYTYAASGNQGDQAILTSPCLDIGSLNAPLLSFYYHMYGYGMGKLSVDVQVEGVWIEDVFEIVGQVQTANTDPWLKAVIALDSLPGAEKVRFRVTRGNSMLGNVSIDDIRITPLQVVFPNAGSDTFMCSGDTLSLAATVTGGTPPYVWHWGPSLALSNPGVQNPLAFPVTSQEYILTVTDQNGNQGADTIMIDIHPLPWVTLDLPFDSICLSGGLQVLSGGVPLGGTYSGPGISGDTLDPQLAGTGHHTIVYRYEDPFTGCGSQDTMLFYVDLCVGWQDIDKGSPIRLFPNPTSGILNLQPPAAMAPFELILLDVMGRVVMKHTAGPEHAGQLLVLDLAACAPGLYVIRIKGDGHVSAHPVILR